jgi:predicted AlkP superfamily pyrophosphatase or phosphodiesterase
LKRLCAFVPLFFVLCTSAQVAPRPKLVITVVVDQFRYDYLWRFRSDYAEGLDKLLKEGAVFADSQYEQVPTVTAVGHSLILSGANPSVSGIIGNEWFDRSTGKPVTSVSDDSTRLLGGGGGPGASPRRLLVSTVGDELKMAGQGRCRLFGISLKDRSAILPAGHTADGAFWFDTRSGAFVSSSYYFDALPRWVQSFNSGKPANRYSGAAWGASNLPAESGEKLYSAVVASPFGNELLESFAERLIREENLGRGDNTDILTVSFSSNDYVGHQFGPDSPQVREITIRTDRLLGNLFRFADAEVGTGNLLVIFTSDHGVAPVPEGNAARRMPGGRIKAQALIETAQKALAGRYGAGNWIAGGYESSVYLNRDLVRARNLDEAAVQQTAAAAIAELPHVSRVFTAAQLVAGAVARDQVGTRVSNGFNAGRAGELLILLEPYWIEGELGTTHGSPYIYDAHVPLIFMGRGIKPGMYSGRVVQNDIAPTLASILGVDFPSGSSGRILSEIFAPSR